MSPNDVKCITSVNDVQIILLICLLLFFVQTGRALGHFLHDRFYLRTSSCHLCLTLFLDCRSSPGIRNNPRHVFYVLPAEVQNRSRFSVSDPLMRVRAHIELRQVYLYSNSNNNSNHTLSVCLSV